MNFRVLRYFVAVASSLSFSRAADNLHISQSTLSQQIQQLEKYYGVQLFIRQGRAVTLTAAGIELQKTASQLLTEQEQLKDRLRSIDSGARIETYPLRIFFDSHMTQGPHLISGVIESVLELQRETQNHFSFSPRFTSEDLDDPRIDLNEILSNQETDIWIFGAESIMTQAGLRVETLFTDQFALLISRNHPLYCEDLSINDIPFLLDNTTLYMVQNRSRYLRPILDMLPGGREINPAIRFERSADVISVYVALGQGVSIVPQDNKNENMSIDCKAITIPDTAFYTLLACREEETNPLIPRMIEILMKKINPR